MMTLERAIREDERKRCSDWLANYAREYVAKWTAITPDGEDDHKATAFDLLMASKRMLEDK
jgi:hypothetical protein